MKEQTQLLCPLADERKVEKRFTIKKVLMYALLTFILYQIVGMVTKRLWWRLNTTCTWRYNDQDYAMNFAKCIPQSLECRQNCTKEDQECNKKCYDLDSSCYQPYYGPFAPKIEKCENSHKLVFEL
jgi:hypothetical protein